MNTEINVDAIVGMHCASKHAADIGSPNSTPLSSEQLSWCGSDEGSAASRGSDVSGAACCSSM